MGSRFIKLGLMLMGLLAVALGVGAWNAFHVEEIPEQLEALDEALEPDDIVLPGAGTETELALAALRGKTVFLVLVGRQTGKSKEGRALHRALNRWSFPDETQGFIVGDAQGFAIFKSKIDELMGHFGAEMKFPLYVDYQGVVLETFKLPKGHDGFVALGPTGDVLMRHSGPSDEAHIEEVRHVLGAREPDPGAEAPAFDLGALSKEVCRGKLCALAFLGQKVSRAQIPMIEGGFEGNEKEMLELMKHPAVRLAGSLLRMKLEDGALGAVVGEVGNLELEGWNQIDASAPAREAFGIGADETAFVVVDRGGRIAFQARGLIRMYQWGTIADILGVELAAPKGHDERDD